VAGLAKTLALAEPILVGLGFGAGRVATIETDDPDALGETLRSIAAPEPAPRPASFMPVGAKRDVLRLALLELRDAAPVPADVIALPEGAPFGAVEIDVDGCTLCLSCVSACPTGAGRSRSADAALYGECLRAVRVVQGDLPGKGDRAQAAARYPCRQHARPRAQGGEAVPLPSVRQAVRRQDRDRPRRGQARRQALDVSGGGPGLEAFRMCGDCRVIAAAEASFDGSRAPPRPELRTAEHYLRERAQRQKGEA
jgi:ferredoxin